MSSSMNLGKVEIWETSLDRIVTLREGAKGVLRPRFHRARRLEIPPTNSRLIHGSASGAGGDEPRTQRWYRQAKETKRGEMGGRESQHLIVPLKRGNQPEGPRQGKGVPSHEPLKRNLAGTS